MTNPTVLAKPIATALAKHFLAYTAVLFMCTVLASTWVPQRAATWFSTDQQFGHTSTRLVSGTVASETIRRTQITPTPEGKIEIEFGDGSLNADQFRRLTWDVNANPRFTSANLEWTADDVKHARPFTFTQRKNQADPINLAADPRWTGTVRQLRIVAQTADTITFGSIELKTDSVLSRLQTTAKAWFADKPWKLTDVNFIEGADDETSLHFQAMLAFAFVVCALTIALKNKQQPIATYRLPLIALAVSMWGWAALRTQADLTHKAIETISRFAMKDEKARQLASDDQEFFWVMQRVKELTNTHIAGAQNLHVAFPVNEPFYEQKLGYYAVPANVIPPTATLAKGTVFAVVRVPAQHNTATGELKTAGYPTLRAEEIEKRGAARIFRVR